MSEVDSACIRCGAELVAPDQEYCLECGARQSSPPAPQWRRPLIAAALTLALTALVMVLVYEGMRDDADSSAAGQPGSRGGAVTRSAASGPAGGNGSRQPGPAVRLAAQRSP
jgi:hypothetical protein